MPAVLLPEPVMIDVMTDVQLMEGVIGYKRSSGQKSLYLKEVGYDSLFSHHGITDSIFIDNVRYYFESRDIKIYVLKIVIYMICFEDL